MVQRQDVHHRELQRLVRMIERQAVRGARAAVMAGDEKLFEAEMRHDVDLVLRHAAERVIAVVVFAARLGAVAVAAQIGRDDRKLLRQPVGIAVPAHVRQRVAVQQKQRRSVSAMPQIDLHFRIAGLNLDMLEILEHDALLYCNAETRSPITYTNSRPLCQHSTIRSRASCNRRQHLLTWRFPYDSRFTIPDSRLTTHDSRLTTHDSRLTIHDSRLTIHDSRLTINHSRNFTCSIHSSRSN